VKPLWAQVKAALVQSVDEPGRNPYSSDVDLGICQSAVQCVFAFNGVPAGKRLVVTSLTGMIYLDTPGVVSSLDLHPQGGTGAGVLIPTSLQAGTVNGNNMVGVSSLLTSYFEPGSSAQMIISSTTNMRGGRLTLSGYLVSVP
jgi:hypothetical protein